MKLTGSSGTLLSFQGTNGQTYSVSCGSNLMQLITRRPKGVTDTLEVSFEQNSGQMMISNFRSNPVTKPLPFDDAVKKEWLTRIKRMRKTVWVFSDDWMVLIRAQNQLQKTTLHL